MPDHGGRQAEEIERTLATVSNGHLQPDLPDYGTALLETSAIHQLSGRRKVNGGIIFPANYKGPVVNIRAPKWLDCVFWIGAEYFEAAQYIADMVFYFTGRGPFHFRDACLRYPPLRLGTGEVLNTMEKCSAHVAKIAKGPALRNERGDYRERVQKLVLEMVKSSEVVRFLNNLRAPHLVIPEAANSEQDSSVTEEHGTPMEVDAVSEQAIHSLIVPALHSVDQFHIADMSLFRDLDLSSFQAFTPGFGMTLGMDLDEAFPSILHSEGHSIGVGCGRKAEAYPIPSNLDVLLTGLDAGEEETFRSTKLSDWEEFVSPKPDNSFHTLRYGTAPAGSRLQALDYDPKF